MTAAAIEIHDAGLLAIGEHGSALAPPSPGCALVGERGVITGEDASRRCRVEPKRVHDRFWIDLDTAALGRPFPAELAAADLAHAHLAHLWSVVGAGIEGVTLALPGAAEEQQLALVLGIARACGIPVRGLVDAGVAACAWVGAQGRALHLDAELHRMVLTEIDAGSGIERRSVKVLGGAGLRSLRDAWLRRIGELFVRRTRFDPLHAAATEQVLFDRLPDILQELARAEVTGIDLGERRRIDLTRADLVAVAAADYDGIVRLVASGLEGGRGSLWLSHSAASLPGLSDRLAAECGLTPAVLPAGAAGRGALRHREAIESDGEALPYVTRLPAAGGSIARSRSIEPPTHVVHEGLAHPLGSGLRLGPHVSTGPRGLAIAGDGEAEIAVDAAGTVVLHPRGAAWVNGERARGETPLRAGDRLRLGRTDLLLVRLVGTDGPA